MTKRKRKSKQSRRATVVKQPARPAPPRRSLRLLLSGVVALVFALLAFAFWAVFGRAAAPVDSFEVVRSFPHDPDAFTQGLLYADGAFYESTGRYGASSLRKVEAETGRVLKSLPLSDRYFAEGLALWENQLLQLTYRSGVGFVYDRETFQSKGEFAYPTEGWGLTHDGRHLIMSDGSYTLRFLDPKDYRVAREIQVSDAGRPIHLLNELEFVKGEIYANIWRSNRIARISPRNGKVLGWIDLGSLAREVQSKDPGAEVLNGVAYDAEQDRLFVTGKFWPEIFEIRVKPQ